MTAKQIRDLVDNEQVEQIFVMIKNADVRTTKTAKKFIAFTFQDSSGTIEAKFWDAQEADIARFTTGKVVVLDGKRELYQGNPQMKISHLRLATPEEGQDPERFVERAPLHREEMVEEISNTLFEITNPHWNRILRYLLTKHQQAFFEYPAAKRNHHAFTGGLAFHTVSMLRIAKALVKEYPSINSGLLYAGVILHDLGKVSELTGAIGTEYTLEGNLVGHLVIVDEEIYEACMHLKFDTKEEDIILLRHMVLSHHGLLEYGSPVRPRLLEAEMLHQIDLIDASMQMMLTAMDGTEPGNYTEKIFGMDSRSFYVPKSK